MSLQTTDSPPKPAVTATRNRISAQATAAINAMVWEGLPRAQAAAKAGMTEHGLYKALRKPPVKALYLSELEVLRTSDRARRYHRYMQLAEQDDNKAAAVSALNSLERIEDQGVASGSVRQMPGLTIVIEAPRHIQHVATNEAKPLIDIEAVRLGGVRTADRDDP